MEVIGTHYRCIHTTFVCIEAWLEKRPGLVKLEDSNLSSHSLYSTDWFYIIYWHTSPEFLMPKRVDNGSRQEALDVFREGKQSHRSNKAREKSTDST